MMILVFSLAFKVRGQREKGEEVEAELQRQLGKLKGEVGKDFMDANAVGINFLCPI